MTEEATIEKWEPNKVPASPEEVIERALRKGNKPEWYYPQYAPNTLTRRGNLGLPKKVTDYAKDFSEDIQVLFDEIHNDPEDWHDKLVGLFCSLASAAAQVDTALEKQGGAPARVRESIFRGAYAVGFKGREPAYRLKPRRALKLTVGERKKRGKQKAKNNRIKRRKG